jgi:GTPase SAR1 family protein
MGKNHSKPQTSDGAYRIKLLFFGDKSVGKTSIIDRFMNDTFLGQYEPTMG